MHTKEERAILVGTCILNQSHLWNIRNVSSYKCATFVLVQTIWTKKMYLCF